MTEYVYAVFVELKDGTALPALEGVKLYGPAYGSLGDADVLAAIRAEPQKYGYAVDRQAGVLYLGSVAVPIETVRGIRGVLLSMSKVEGA